MNTVCLRFYAREGEQHRARLIHDYLLEQAKALGASGATVMRASAGFGRHGWHETTFFELGGDLPVVIEIILAAALADEMLALCAAEQLHLFYTLMPVMTGITGSGPVHESD